MSKVENRSQTRIALCAGAGTMTNDSHDLCSNVSSAVDASQCCARSKSLSLLNTVTDYERFQISATAAS